MVIKNKWGIKNKKWFVKIRYNVMHQKFWEIKKNKL